MSIPILICDDSALARKQMARALPADWDIKIKFASQGEECLEMLKSTKAEVLFLDLTMPVMDGYEVLAKLFKAKSEVMVIVVSGDIQPKARERVMSLGALDFIKKPVDAEHVRSILEQYGILDRDGATSDAHNLDVDIRDCYQEVVNVAMGQAADLLARVLDVFVVLPIPNVNLLEVSELSMALQLAEDEDSVSAVCQGFIGAGISGEALLFFSDSSFSDFAKLMKYEGELDDQIELELLMDVSNILIGACLNGVAAQLDMHFSQGHPVVLGRHQSVADLVRTNSSRWRKTLAFEINYKIRDYDIHCDLLILFTEDSLETLNMKVGFLSE